MNYFEFYPGDYLRDTTRLNLSQHGAYLRLLMTYFSEESPLPQNVKELFVIVCAVSRADKEAVRYIADRFFPVSDDGLRHNWRADQDIEKAQKRIRTAQENGSKGGRKPNPVGNPPGTPLGGLEKTQRGTHRGTHSGEALHTPLEEQELKEEEREKPTPDRKVEIGTWLNSLNGADAIPGDDPVFKYADDSGIPIDFLALSWIRFRDDMRERKTRKINWRAHYRNAVKGNWYKLWWIAPDGECKLTTAGEQARRASA